MHTRNIHFLSICVCLITLSFCAGCSRFNKPGKKVIATVNGQPLHAVDLKRALALKLKTDPRFKVTPSTLDIEMDNLIDNRLLIGEAQKMGLNKKKRFADTIKTFWEQTLIRELIIAKNAEFNRDIAVTPDEIKDYYGKLGVDATFKIIRRKNKEPLEKVRGMEEGLVAWQDVVGPVNYLEIKSQVLRAAFELPVGGSEIYEEGGLYYLVFVAKKDPAAVPKLDDVRPVIERKVKRNKQNSALKNWLNDLKSRSDIEIFTGELNPEKLHVK